MFTPIVLLPRILKKIQTDKATALIPLPQWEAQIWFPVLLRILGDYQRQLLQEPGLIRLSSDPLREPPTYLPTTCITSYV